MQKKIHEKVMTGLQKKLNVIKGQKLSEIIESATTCTSFFDKIQNRTIYACGGFFSNSTGCIRFVKPELNVQIAKEAGILSV